MSVTEDIKARVDIVDLMQAYNVPLKKAGRNYKAPCPFHNERTPSFVVFPDSGTWRCFGACGDGGDIFSFVMKQENVDFSGALEQLANRAGIELRPRTPEQSTRDAALDKLRGLLTETTQFFYRQLLESPLAEDTRQYVSKRGLNDETVEKFLIGYAPKEDWRRALSHLQTLGYSEDEIIEAGVATRSEKGKVYDRFRDRLMIPIRDVRGQVIGFGARALAKDDNPKYLNSPQTPLFDKGSTLFALDAARRSIRESETAVIVEGYMDALQAHQAGFTNVVAQMGTALTEPQLRQLARYAKRLILALDPDAAGVGATMRGLNVARQTLGSRKLIFDPNAMLRQTDKLDIDIRVMTLPEGQDPDDLIRDEPERWQLLIDTAQPIIDYVIEAGTAQVTPQSSLPDRENIARELLPLLMESEPHRHYSVQRLAFRLRINERDLIALAQRQQKEAQPAVPSAAQQKSRMLPSPSPTPITAKNANSPTISAMEGYCLAVLIERPDLWPVINRKLAEVAGGRDARDQLLGPFSARDFTRTDYQAIMNALERAVDQDDAEPLEYLRQTLPAELCEEIDRLQVGPLSSIQRPGTWEAREMESLLKDKTRVLMNAVIRIEEEFVEKALQLRSRRLRRESDELFFLQSEGGDDHALATRVSRYRIARREIDQALLQMRQTHHQA